ncbi:class F sortase [Arthrobacter sp. PAMC25564]|uniref:class F sortase n=1 Tax=Arthrobacter sp. PAMC25564 TaxID=2565366 RepID=UPI0010A20257|nr:class F sortase [Arthrobacter sp. PAMC25564]QCB97169.1 class F sortase [Arthrobacter sp. PAMC25564]
MASHCKTRQFHGGAPRSLILGRRDWLLLAACIVGLLVAWLVYGAIGPDDGRSLAGSAGTGIPTASAPAIPATPASGPAQSRPAQSGPASFGDALAVPPATGRPAGAPRAAPGPVASAPQRISYPAAGMDVVVHPLQPDADSQSIVPPETMDGYWLSTFGSPGAGSTNTTYIIGHSWEGLDAPFNHLSSAAAPGDRFAVTTATGVVEYTVDSVATYRKSTLKDSSVWTAVPNRIVLISCYTEDLWGVNLVVTASPAAGK